MFFLEFIVASVVIQGLQLYFEMMMMMMMMMSKIINNSINNITACSFLLFCRSALGGLGLNSLFSEV